MNSLKKIALAVLLLLAAATTTLAQTASLLPNGQQQFVDANGQPLASGLVYTYVPGTTTPKTTWQDPNQAVANANPIILNSAGRAIIYGAGQYRQVLVDQYGNTIWDQLTYGLLNTSTNVFTAGSSGGSANAQTISATVPSAYSLSNNPTIIWTAGFTNTGPLSLNVDTTGAISVYKQTPGGLVALVGGEVVSGTSYAAVYNGTQYALINYAIVPGIAWAIASGTSDAITASYIPINESLTDGLTLGFRASAANTTNTPTFSPDGLTAETITQNGGQPLIAGSIPGNYAEEMVRYDAGASRTIPGCAMAPCPSWELLNPAKPPPAQLLIAGLLPTSISASSATNATLVVSTGQATDTTDVSVINSSSTISWATSNGNAINGYSGGTTLPNSSTIHFYLCYGTSGIGVYAIPNTSYPLVAASCPTGYTTYARRIFSLVTSAGGVLLTGTAVETGGGAMRLYLGSVVTDLNATSITTTASLQTMTVPLGYKLEWVGRVGSTGNYYVLVTSPDEPDLAVGTPTTSPGADLDQNSTYATDRTLFVTTNTSGQIRFRQSNTANVYAFTRGWTDFRRN